MSLDEASEFVGALEVVVAIHDEDINILRCCSATSGRAEQIPASVVCKPTASPSECP
jgi:hypothetical protein